MNKNVSQFFIKIKKTMNSLNKLKIVKAVQNLVHFLEFNIF
jgi:hypothetical protein